MAPDHSLGPTGRAGCKGNAGGIPVIDLEIWGREAAFGQKIISYGFRATRKDQATKFSGFFF